MHRRTLYWTLILTAAGIGNAPWAVAGEASDLRPSELRCEYLVNPLGIDVPRPRLSWALESGRRGQRQTAHRVLVASSARRLAEGEGDLWDSGRVESSRSVHVAYAGKPLGSRQACHWRVQVWDADGRASAWSQAATWSMGLLHPGDWQAQWISDAPGITAPPWPNGYRSRAAATGDAVKWVQLDLGKPQDLDGVRLARARPSWREEVEACGFPLRFKIEVGNRPDLADAQLAVDRTAADVPDPFTTSPAYRFSRRVARYVRLTATALRPLRTGEFLLALDEMMVTSGGRNVALGAAVTASDSLEEERWSTRFLVDGASLYHSDEIRTPMPWLRKTFLLPARPSQALAYVASTGYFELYVNGRKVDDHVLSPAVSDLSQRAFYVTHDVARYLRPGKNCIALWLGRGWSDWTHYRLRHRWMAKAQLEAALDSGERLQVVTDASWKTHPSPITLLGRWSNSQFGGDRYDATQEVADWNGPDLDDSAWQPAAVYSGPGPRVVAQMIEPNRITETIRPVQVESKSPGVCLVDLGRHFTGWAEVRLSGPRGRKITLEYSERKEAECSYHQRDEYVCRGEGTERFCNRFTYHGFRWLLIRGLDQPPNPEDVQGHLIHTAYAPAAEFECSNPLLNRIHQASIWTYRCLSLGGHVVDCPHRERLGYGAEGQAGMECGLWNFDQGAFFTKWLADWRDVQDPRSGHVPHTAPQYIGGGGPAWGGILVTLPWHVYLQYGDRRVLEDCLPQMEKYLQWLDSRSRDNLLQPYGADPKEELNWDFLADWVAPGRDRLSEVDVASRLDYQSPESCRRFFNDCYRVYLLELTARTAGVLGHRQASRRWQQQARSAGAAAHRAFFHPENNTYANGEQPYGPSQ